MKELSKKIADGGTIKYFLYMEKKEYGYEVNIFQTDDYGCLISEPMVRGVFSSWIKAFKFFNHQYRVLKRK